MLLPALLAAGLFCAGAVTPLSPVPGGGRADKLGGDYVVQAGDTLSQIALDHHIRGGAQQLFDQNDDVLVDADHIYAGQRLAIDRPAPRRADGSSRAPLKVPNSTWHLLPSLAPRPAAPSYPPGIADAPWVVSVGDSFVSGEGGRWAGNSAGSPSLVDALGPTAYFDSPLHDRELIPLCHRSKSAIVHIGDVGSPTQPGRPINSLNLACSGAQTTTMINDGAFKPGLDFYNDGPGQQGQALMLEEFARTHPVTTVVASIGGNDFDFAPVIQSCVQDFLVYFSYCSSDPTILARVSPAATARVASRIAVGLDNVRQAMRQAGRKDGSWSLIVDLYPDPLAAGGAFRYPESYSRQTVGGCGIYDRDASWAKSSFLAAVRTAEQRGLAESGIAGAVTLDLQPLLSGHELCASTTSLVGAPGAVKSWASPGAVDDSEWADQIRTVTYDGPYYQQESLHPNYWAQLGARSCLRQMLAQQQAGGALVNGRCEKTGAGLTTRGEPRTTFRPTNAAPRKTRRSPRLFTIDHPPSKL